MTPSQVPALQRYAVIGNPVAHSRSPQIHAMFAEQTHIALEYGRLPAPLDGFRDTVWKFFLAGGRGLNVTVPFKQEAYALAHDHLSARARVAGAVNTLTWRDGMLHGCNTDGVGLVEDLKRLGAALQGARLLLVGAGGAARGVLQPLAETGCAEIRIVNRNPARAAELVAAWQASGIHSSARMTAGGLAEAARSGGWNVVINATASGLLDEAPALPGELYAPDALAYDMVYGPRPTAFMRQATADGAARTADGLGMLVGQAAESFFIWHGKRPDPSPVLTALRAELLAED
ncbi:shikimate dehydrogenase [Bordetella pseudohinzii]|uniref:Shikimate dehydrogenase (NADP(+)) n=1 Tax=Bordetella pseudohinzii TaxID=1331258 RepID=A0A0J6C543_9BORD|nr:shikimate dehydrogenase [Bordetella pseudohinzii]ANY14855.1 shikimate dehydrogenase [Bordetella pseudohinzii]KMM25881.1 shikimate dehydrogenase [Bordetella pseudohinzii]KXA77588.1 shikimate dehydrogenase [Bordetella pseudohinzii]KXA77734.1 shikimate dehydrogenase [Bordetella pseudohinzii]CUI93660.1 Shikimate dehydrogenase [Bordetella pseudohinzii]